MYNLLVSQTQDQHADKMWTRLVLRNMIYFLLGLKIRQLAPFSSIDYPEVLYADDTLIFGIDTYAIDWQTYLQARVYKVLLSIDINL